MRAIGIGVLLLLSARPTSAEETGLRWLTVSAPVLDAPAGQELGAALIATPVRAIGHDAAGFAQIALPGFTDAAGRGLYATPARAVELARVTPERLSPRPLGPGETTAPGWRPVELRGWIATSTLTADPAPMWQKAFTLYRSRCTACHPRRVPGKYSLLEWQDYFRQMGPRTRLPQDDQRLIRAWLQHRAGDAAAFEAAVARIAAGG
ncbi:trimethylamine-N-oxide reductase cytochrome c-type subunit TorC [Rhodobacter viridis]|uniref:Trimethylamine-N-oxide reductase cytochrome c-type subunit TorC n=1 Tax=Rhodobacter viridis TaxID=1054202 RepID=A0A318U090_9RHOB|nr:hypothetical protein [Rhodobacter viridis]PYF08648.1 trimethylamine-N-oxide reductase cytochrome c-type subunit TorC [Rhodobacter viridis]